MRPPKHSMASKEGEVPPIQMEPVDLTVKAPPLKSLTPPAPPAAAAPAVGAEEEDACIDLSLKKELRLEKVVGVSNFNFNLRSRLQNNNNDKSLANFNNGQIPRPIPSPTSAATLLALHKLFPPLLDPTGGMFLQATLSRFHQQNLPHPLLPPSTTPPNNNHTNPNHLKREREETPPPLPPSPSCSPLSHTPSTEDSSPSGGGGGGGPGRRRKIHRCDFTGCEKVYTKSSHLKAHRRTHTGN